jgi:hypothetical protein
MSIIFKSPWNLSNIIILVFHCYQERDISLLSRKGYFIQAKEIRALVNRINRQDRQENYMRKQNKHECICIGYLFWTLSVSFNHFILFKLGWGLGYWNTSAIFVDWNHCHHLKGCVDLIPDLWKSNNSLLLIP